MTIIPKTRKSNISAIKSFGGLLFLLSLLFVVGWGYVKLGGFTYSEGERSGVITKFSHKGIMIKTWEGELNMGGFDQGGVATTWQFSVDDPEIVAKLQAAQRTGGRWALHYRQQLMSQSWKGQTDYFVIGVEQIR